MIALFLAQVVATPEMPSQGMLDRKPVMELASVQSADQLQQCVGLALERIGRPIVTRVAGRRYVTFAGVAKSPVLVTIYEGSPTRIEARTSFALNKKWRNRIRFCAS
jgi:hypothetical protein